MKRSICLTLLLTLVILFFSAACGAKDAAAPAADAAPEEAQWNAVSESAGDGGVYGETVSQDYNLEDNAASMNTASGSVYDREDAKLIRRAELTIETLEFDEAIATLDAMVQKYDGYYESSDVWGGAYKGATRSGHYIVRIPKDAYTGFMNAAGAVGNLVRRMETTQDIGEEYFDTELRLGTLETKHERLLDMLEKATDMESIITLQGYLSEVEYEIDYLSGSLRRYDSLIGYATIQISLEEKTRLSSEPGEKSGFGTQLGMALANGLGSFGEGLQSFLLWIAYNLFAILLVAVVIVAGVLVWRKKLRGFIQNKKVPKKLPEDTSKPDNPS